jgi:type VI secretion system protein ImpE
LTITDLIKDGQLSDARSRLIEQVKASPTNTSARTLLFQVLILGGEWDKAKTHLDAIAVQEKEPNPGFLHYKNMIIAEQQRSKVASLEELPSFLPKTPHYFQTYYQALGKIRENKASEAVEIFSTLQSQIPEISGTINGNDFTGLRDTDSTLAYFLEIFVHDRYVWVPLEELRELVITPPESLFDLIWVPASLTTWEGLTMNCFAPVLYPDSATHNDTNIKMGKLTEWSSLGSSLARGIGQHVFEAGEEDISLLEIREAHFNFT